MKLDKNTKISPFVIARYEHGYETASSLYKEIHLDGGTYSMWENGNASRISEGRTFAAFHRMCEVFGWTLEGGRNNLSNMYKWKHDDKIKIIKPTYDEWKEMRGHTEMATLDTSKTDISKEEAMLNNPLKVWRGKNNLTRSEAAKLCNVDINVYSDCEDGVKKPIGYDLTKIMNTTGVSLTQLAAMFRATVGMEALKNAIEASKNPDPITLEEVIGLNDEEVTEALDKKNEVTKNEYPLNFIVDRCGLPSEDWIVEEFDRQMDEKVYASKDAASYIFFKPERDAIRKVFRDGVQEDDELFDSIDTAVLAFKNHIKKSADLIGTVAEKITEAKNEKLAKEIAIVIDPIYGLTSAKISKPKAEKITQDPMQKKLANQTVSYLKEENVLDGSDRPANNSRNIAISKYTARVILQKLYGVLEFSEYYKILSEFTKGGLNL